MTARENHARHGRETRQGHAEGETQPALASQAASELFAALYNELRRLSQYHLSRGSAAISMGATTLLHKAYIDMAKDAPAFDNLRQFVGYAAQVMRGLIVDHARRRYARKRGGAAFSPFTESEVGVIDNRETILVSDALDELAKVDGALVEIVNLKFFCGFSLVEIASMQGVSERTIQRGWEKARIYLRQSLHPRCAQDQP